MKQLTAVSLFAGVGGFDLALERNGVKVVASVEIDQKASAILAKQFPNSKLFNDIKGVTGEQLINAGFDPENGIITGGFPCQDLSVAGKRAGLDGNRSGLFYEIVRLLDETKAKYFILENVVGLLSSNNGADMGAVIGALVERGYGVAYRVLDAQHFGVPQRRRRVFIVGCARDSGRTPAQILALTESSIGHFKKGTKSRKNTAFATPISLTENGESRKVVNTLSAELYHHGSIVNQDLANGHLVLFDPHHSDGVRIQGETVNTLTAKMGTGGNNVPMVASWWDGNQTASTITVNSDKQRMPDKNHLQAVITYSMHGAMVGRKETAGPNGSGFLGENDPSYTLTASQQSRHGVAIIHNPSTFANYSEQEIVGTLRAGMPRGSEPLVTQTNSIVRRLTPLECERLQGFPDDWTSGQADQHRYKQMGNAVAVPVVEFIVKRLVGEINA
jgi:DNA (cytosine-5)-methyltransferase 1